MYWRTNRNHTDRLPFKMPEGVRKRMERLHPTVRIVWDHGHQMFAMLCLERDGIWSIMCGMAFEPPITLQKTVYRLNDALKPVQWSERDKDKHLDWLDAQAGIDEAAGEAAAQEYIEEGSDRLLHLLNKKIIVPKPHVPTQFQRPDRVGSRANQRPRNLPVV